MSLKELTQEQHRLAEQTPFMKAVFAGNLPVEVWADYTHNKSLWYNAIETMAKSRGLLDDLPDLERTHKLYLDYKEMTNGESKHQYRPAAIEYYKYILSLNNPDQIMAHLYTWHMGDLYGGQMIKRVLSTVPHRNLEFKDADTLKTTIRAKLNDGMADEANQAFAWAIKIMNEYNHMLPG